MLKSTPLLFHTSYVKNMISVAFAMLAKFTHESQCEWQHGERKKKKMMAPSWHPHMRFADLAKQRMCVSHHESSNKLQFNTP